MSGNPVLVLERRRVAELLSLEDCIQAVGDALCAAGRGAGHRSSALGVHVEHGGFHVKSAVLEGRHPWFVAKANANFPGNRLRFGLPTIQGAILVFEAETGRLIAIMDSIEITRLRTAAATAVAARHLARAASSTLTICGCGEQGRVHLEALAGVLPITRAFVWDRERCRSDRMAQEQASELGFEITPIVDLATGTRHSDVIVTCTPSKEYLIDVDDVRPGTFVAAVGADHPEKREIHPRRMATAKVVVDDLDQCAQFGDLHHALESGLMVRPQVHGTLADVVAGRTPGRVDDREVTIFDSTGIALEDAASAVRVVERAAQRHDLISLTLGD